MFLMKDFNHLSKDPVRIVDGKFLIKLKIL